MSDHDSYIRIDAVSKHFGPVVAVDRVRMDISKGEFFSLLGPSGCGKTTLLRMLAGFETPTRGEIYLDGAAITQVPPHQRPTNMVFQSYAIFPHLNVLQNVAYGLRKEGLSRDELARRCGEALEMVKLDGFEKRRATELSGGQRQRVALARALVKRPKVLLLDEPLGALDKKLRGAMQLELRALQRSVGITFVFVTHDQEEALTMSDRIAVMARGSVLQTDNPRDLYERPQSVEVADFIGEMNFFDARVTAADGGSARLGVDGLGELAISTTRDFVRKGAAIKVALRPEKLHLHVAAPGDGLRAVRGRVSAAAYLGDRSHFYVELPGLTTPVSVAAQNVDESLAEHREARSELWLSWLDESLVVLPAP